MWSPDRLYRGQGPGFGGGGGDIPDEERLSIPGMKELLTEFYVTPETATLPVVKQ